MKKSVRSVTVLQNHYELVPARLCGLLEPELLNLYTCLPPDKKTIYNLVRLKRNYLAEIHQSYNAEKKDVLLT